MPKSCVHSTRVVFNPSKVKIRVRVPMDAFVRMGRHSRASPFRRYSLGAGPRLVAAIAWVRIPVAAFSLQCFLLLGKKGGFFVLHFVGGRNTFPCARFLSYGHTTMKAPHPIRTAKLSIVGPDQYYSWGQCGNLGCCTAFIFIFSLIFFESFGKSGKKIDDLRTPRFERGISCV